jgi:hypothetical protein
VETAKARAEFIHGANVNPGWQESCRLKKRDCHELGMLCLLPEDVKFKIGTYPRKSKSESGDGKP